MSLSNLVIKILGVLFLGQASLGGPMKLSTQQRILIVGDSHLGGTYGQRLYQRLSYAPSSGVLAREVSLYSACGSTSKDWSVSDPDARKATLCGLRVAKPNASLKAPLTEIPPEVVTTYVNGRRKKKYIYPKIPILGELLKGADFSYSSLNQSPDLVIVSLGTNMIGAGPGLLNEIDKIFVTQSVVAPYATCVWVGPPACDRMANGTPCDPRLKNLNQTMAKFLRGRCHYVDSTKLSHYPPEADPQQPLTDGYHFRTTCRASQPGCSEMTNTMRSIAEKWADSVFEFLVAKKVVKIAN